MTFSVRVRHKRVLFIATKTRKHTEPEETLYFYKRYITLQKFRKKEKHWTAVRTFDESDNVCSFSSVTLLLLYKASLKEKNPQAKEEK